MVALTRVFRDVVPVRPAPYGLLSPAATVIVDSDPHWQAGFEHRSSDFVQVHNIAIEDQTIEVTVADGEGDFSKEYVPFSVRVSFTASTFGNKPEEVREAVQMYIEAATQKAIEREFWTGGIAKQLDESPNRYLASEDAVILNPASGTPVKTKYGLALLEQALGDNGIGEAGTIHATRGVASALGIKGNKGVIETPIGNTLVAGTGYTGTSPTGEAPTGDQAWMYATGPVVVRLGASDIHESSLTSAVSINNNTIKYSGYRTGAVTWLNESHFAVLVDLAADYS